MAAEIPTFNASGLNGLKKLDPQNGAMEGWLAGNGNTVSVAVESLAVKGSTFSAPGSTWEARRVTGFRPRRVVWGWRVVAGNQSNLNLVEAELDKYVADGGRYVLADGKGRSSDMAVLLGAEAGTGRIGRRETFTDGRKGQQWRLVFRILMPKLGAGVL